MVILLSGELYNSCMKVLARFLQLKGHKRHQQLTQKICGSHYRICCLQGGFLAGCTCTLHKTKPNSTSSCYESPRELQCSTSPFKGMRDRRNRCPETSGSSAGGTRQTQQGDGADKVCSRRLATWKKGKLVSEDKRGRWLTGNRVNRRSGMWPAPNSSS